MHSNQEDDKGQRTAKVQALLTSPGLLSYLWRLLRTSKPWRRWRELLAVWRRLRAIVVIVRMLTFIVSMLETGALILFSTLLFLVLLPLGLALMLGILLTAALESGKSNRRLAQQLPRGNVYLLFFYPEEDPIFWEKARALTARGTVLVVSPFWISSRGMPSSRGFYFTCRTEAPNLVLIRRYYFFSLRKHVLSRCKSLFYGYEE